jgi:hypothetical protein
MIKMTFESNSSDGVNSCALAIPAGCAGKTVTIETGSEYLKLFVGNDKEGKIIHTPSGKYIYTVPNESLSDSDSEIVIIAEIVQNQKDTEN